MFLSRFGGSMQIEGWQNMIKKIKIKAYNK